MKRVWINLTFEIQWYTSDSTNNFILAVQNRFYFYSIAFWKVLPFKFSSNQFFCVLEETRNKLFQKYFKFQIFDLLYCCNVIAGKLAKNSIFKGVTLQTQVSQFEILLILRHEKCFKISAGFETKQDETYPLSISSRKCWNF